MHSPEAVIEALACAPEIVVPRVREVPSGVLKRRPAPSRWSAHEHSCQLAHVHALCFERLDLLPREPEPFIRGFLLRPDWMAADADTAGPR